MKKRIITLLLAVATVFFAVPIASFPAFAVSSLHNTTGVTYTGKDNEKIIYNFLMNTMGVNEAVAAGILANLYSESQFDPNAQFIEADDSLSYGICQWNKVRLTALKAYCSDKGYDYTSLTGQLYYMKYELEGSESSAYSKIKNVSNTIDGAYSAGYNWAQYYERCASRYYEGRACLSRDSFWPIYGFAPSVLTAYGINYPQMLSTGSHYSMYGSIVSPYKLTRVEVSIKTSGGAILYTYSTSGSTYVDLKKGADSEILYNKLSDGTYYYCVYAEDSRGYVLNISKMVTVGFGETIPKIITSQTSWHNHGNVLGYSWNSGTVVFEPTLEDDGLILYTCFCGESKTEVIPKLISSFTISYDANGGEGAPAEQGKERDVAVTLRDTVLERTDYIFLGWAESASATTVIYEAGGIYNKNADVTLYAVWREEYISVKEVTFSMKNISAYVGDVLKLEATIWPSDADNQNLIWESSDNNIVVVDQEGYVSAVGAGSAVITATAEDGKGSYATCNFMVVPEDHVHGDLNGDGKVNSQDMMRLMKLISGMEVPAYFPDVNGDGKVNSIDLIRLMKFISEEPVEFS